MLKFNSLLIFSQHPDKLVDFYKKVLGEPGWSGGDFTGFQAGEVNIAIGPHSEVHGKSKESARMMFNLETKDVKKEFERIKKTGAKVVKEPYNPMEMADDKGEGDALIATFEDPDGNYFQLVSPWDM